MLALNVLLAMIWAAGTGQFSLANLVVGFVLGYLVLRLMYGILPDSGYFLRVRRVITFMVFTISEIIRANLRISRDVLTPSHTMRPGIVAVPLDVEKDNEILLLTTLISLTPGSLVLDVSNDRRVLYIHAMHVRDRESFIREIKHGFERRVLEVLR
jgi:multicomponent Na+:H+ antiporter subunit E